MRTAFIETLCELAERDKRIWLLTGDLGYSVLERFAECFPDRYVNVGVAEQNMTGVAAGLAMCGEIVFTYSIANFPIMRCLEQIRNDVCYHNANVKIVSIGGGLTYGSLGFTHHGIEDLAIMRALPNMTVIAPGDPVETQLATKAIVDRPGPCYLRLGKAGEAIVHQTPPAFQIGKAIVVRKGTDVALITTGGMLKSVVQAADQLALHGISTRVLSVHTLKPLDTNMIQATAREVQILVTVEEHRAIGGLGSAVADILEKMGLLHKPLLRLSLPEDSLGESGSQDYLRERYGLSSEAIVKRVLVRSGDAG